MSIANTLRTSQQSRKRRACVAVALFVVANLASGYVSALQAQSLDWMAINRSLSFAAGKQHQAYRELDTQGSTSDGELNQETGQQNHAQAALRWQWVNGINTQLSYARQNGATTYQGYLQSGSGNLTPYAARTGNVSSQTALQLGYALNSSTVAYFPVNLQLTPLLQITQHHWQRNLAQYREIYRHTSTAAGLRLQWQPLTSSPSTVVEAQALAGRTQPARVTVPAFDFNAQQASGRYRQWQLGASHDISQYFSTPALTGWRVNAQISSTRYTHGASAVVGGLQAPPNHQRPRDWSLGISKHF
jgi:hypothetical protein